MRVLLSLLLLAVIPTIGILAAICHSCIPRLLHHQGTCCESLLLRKRGRKCSEQLLHAQHQKIPETLVKAGFTKPLPPQVGSLTIVDRVHGTIGLAMKSGVTKIGDRTLILIPSHEDSGEITWACRSNIDKRYSPPDCLAF